MVGHGVSALVVGAGDGEVFWALGDVAVNKLTSAQSGGSLLITDYTVMPGGGPPLHVHEREDEVFWVLEGEVWFAAADRRERATSGTLVYGPRGVPHTFRNCSDRPARMLVIVTPGENFERFFARVGAPRPDGTPASPAEMVERIGTLAPVHGMRILGPSGLEA